MVKRKVKKRPSSSEQTPSGSRKRGRPRKYPATVEDKAEEDDGDDEEEEEEEDNKKKKKKTEKQEESVEGSSSGAVAEEAGEEKQELPKSLRVTRRKRQRPRKST